MKRQNRKGFTLIELIVVISIIGILSAILVPNLIKYIDDSKITATKADAALIEQRVEMMLLNENEDIEIMACGTGTPAVLGVCSVRVDLDDPYTGKLSAKITDGGTWFLSGTQTEEDAKAAAVLNVIASLNDIAVDSLDVVDIETVNTIPAGVDYINEADFTELAVGNRLYSYEKNGISVLMQFEVE